ncbi:glycerophosphoryl diester phosphodiesterase [Planctobacterium marinum]|uniref:glycerophosphodiester phosphodiesterase n=2 Tax=Planctobacterium marinum TaxID=1631968 RepID=A0AA48HJC1_9ALTE|nr:glycerophosphoryl diester phosphodiesterase [Planctobacterium marinum]
MAYMQGADYVEQDLVLSKDGHLTVLHDIHIDTTTDVAQKFPNRKRPDGRYYAIDLNLAELKSLQVRERTNTEQQQVYENRFRGKAGFQIATLAEHIQIIQQLNRQLNKNVGWYIEIKAPQWHLDQGQDIAEILLNSLNKHNLNHKQAKVFVQCFDFKHTKRLRRELGLKTQLVQLIAENEWGESDTNYEYLKTPNGLAEIAAVADGIGPWIPQILNFREGQYVLTGYTERAQAAGLLVHPYTFRTDALPTGISEQELLDALFQIAKVDGVFSDFSDRVVQYLNQIDGH